MLRARHRGKVLQGKFQPLNPRQFREAFWRFEGKECDVIVDRPRKERSLPQNAYYRGVIVKLLAEEIGYSPDEMHQALKWEFLRVHRDGLPDTVKSTRDLSTVEFEDYCEEIRRWAATEWNLYIPLPGEVDYD